MTEQELAQRAALTDTEKDDVRGAVLKKSHHAPGRMAFEMEIIDAIADAQLKKSLGVSEAERQRLQEKGGEAMNTPPTDKELRAALELAAKATPGPLKFSKNKLGDGHIIAQGSPQGPIAEVLLWKGLNEPEQEQREADAALFVLSHTGYPAAAKALLEMRAVLREMLSAEEAVAGSKEISFTDLWTLGKAMDKAHAVLPPEVIRL